MEEDKTVDTMAVDSKVVDVNVQPNQGMNNMKNMMEQFNIDPAKVEKIMKNLAEITTKHNSQLVNEPFPENPSREQINEWNINNINKQANALVDLINNNDFYKNIQELSAEFQKLNVGNFLEKNGQFCDNLNQGKLQTAFITSNIKVAEQILDKYGDMLKNVIPTLTANMHTILSSCNIVDQQTRERIDKVIFNLKSLLLSTKEADMICQSRVDDNIKKQFETCNLEKSNIISDNELKSKSYTRTIYLLILAIIALIGYIFLKK